MILTKTSKTSQKKKAKSTKKKYTRRVKGKEISMGTNNNLLNIRKIDRYTMDRYMLYEEEHQNE